MNLIEAKTEKQHEAEELNKEKDQLKVIISHKQMRIDELKQEV